MHQFTVGTVAYPGRFVMKCQASVRTGRQKLMYPRAEFSFRKHPCHQFRFGEARGEKVKSRRFPRYGAVFIAQVKIPCPGNDRCFEGLILRCTGIIQGECHAECRVGVLPYPDGINQLWQKILIIAYNEVCERLKDRFPFPCQRMIPGVKLFRQFQQPGPSVRPFKRAVVGVKKKLHLHRDVFRSEVLRKGFFYLRGIRGIRKLFQQFHQHPVAMHRRVPVETTVKRRPVLPYRLHIPVAAQHFPGLVRIFLMNAFQGHARITRCFIFR